MKNKMLLAAAAACAALLCSMRSDPPPSPTGAVPFCNCTTMSAGWNLDAICSGGTTLCSLQTNPLLVTDNLACTGASFPSPCTVSGGITVSYEPCTVLACVAEYFLMCSTCNSSVSQYSVTNGSTAYPQITSLCCNDGAGCVYTFEVYFYGTSGGCLGRSFAYCRYDHQYRCQVP